MISIKCFNKQGLEDFIASAQYRSMLHIPISRHRALSHINNPRAGKDDILLLLAYEDNTMVGYLGVLPDTIHHNKNIEKCGWFSGLWVDPMHRGKKVAFKLITEALKLWQNRIIVSDFANPTIRIYDRTKRFTALKLNEGIRLYVRSDLHQLLAPKHKIFITLQPLVKVLDYGVNLLLGLRLNRQFKTPKRCKIERVLAVDEEIQNFIQDRQDNQLFKRGSDEINWVLNQPWILSQAQSEESEESEKYYFSSVAGAFDLHALKIRNRKNELIAFIILSKREKNLKVPFCYGEDLEAIVEVINYYVVKWRIKTCTIFHPLLASKLWETKTPAVFKKSIHRNFIIANCFDQLPTHFEVQDGDGDYCFT